jgi:hypothetical protein
MSLLECRGQTRVLTVTTDSAEVQGDICFSHMTLFAGQLPVSVDSVCSPALLPPHPLHPLQLHLQNCTSDLLCTSSSHCTTAEGEGTPARCQGRIC